MKFRRAGVTRRHTIIDREVFDTLGVLPGVQHVNPGRIHNTSGRVTDRIRVTRTTLTGLRVLVRTPTCLQEAFLITDSPATVAAAIGALNNRMAGRKDSLRNS